MLIMLMHWVVAVAHREARGTVKQLNQPFGPNLHHCKGGIHRYAKAPPPHSSRQVLFFLKLALLLRICMRRERGGAHTRSSRVSQQPRQLLGVTHFPLLCEFSLPLRTLEGPQNKKKKKKKKNPVVYVHFISPPPLSEEDLDGAPSREQHIIFSCQAFC